MGVRERNQVEGVMTEANPGVRTEPPRHAAARGDEPQGPTGTGWGKWAAFGGVIMLLIGAFLFLEGLTALIDPEYFKAEAGELAVTVSYTGWGVVHIAVGVLVIAAAVALFNRHAWGRVGAVIVSLACVVVAFSFSRADPFWATLVIMLSVLVIYAVTVHGREISR
jgi:hypothetical protein